MKTFITAAMFVASVLSHAQCFQKIYAGNSYYLAISQDGTLWGWGENSNSQLGDGTNTDRTMPVQISNASWAQVSAGTTHSMGIRTDGTLWAWGNDSGGKLGNGGSMGSTNVPVQIGTDTNWKEVHAGEIATIAIRTNGQLWGWGWNTGYFLGNGQATNYLTQVPVQIGTDSNWSTMCAKVYSCLAIKTNGSLWGWGENSLGQLGNGTTTDALTPVQVGTGTNWRSITNNERLTFGIKTDNTLWGWGTQTNTNYLGINGVLSPMQIGTDTNWLSVSVKPVSFFDYLLLLKTNNTLWAWGSDSFEQLGNGTVDGNYATPTQIGSATDWTAVTAGTGASFAVKLDGTFWAWADTALVGTGSGNVAIPTQYACTSLSTVDNVVNTISIYPNPATEKLNFSSDIVVRSVRVFDLNGREYFVSLNSNENSIDVSPLSTGIYILKSETEQGTMAVKFVKAVKK